MCVCVCVCVCAGIYENLISRHNSTINKIAF